MCVVCPQGVGRRYAHVVLRKADIDLTKRAGELTEEEVGTDFRIFQKDVRTWSR